MALLRDSEVEALRALADRLRDQEGDEVCYGFFPGGNPHDFSPDPECCDEDQHRAWERACAEYDAAQKGAPPDQCAFMHAIEGDRPRSDFGLGTYTMRRSDVDLLANDLDRWLDRAREIGDMYG